MKNQKKRFFLIGITLNTMTNTKQYVYLGNSKRLDSLAGFVRPQGKHHIAPLLNKVNDRPLEEYWRHEVKLTKHPNSSEVKYLAIVFARNWHRAMYIW